MWSIAAQGTHQPLHNPMPRRTHSSNERRTTGAQAGSSASRVSNGTRPARWEWWRWLSSSGVPSQSAIRSWLGAPIRQARGSPSRISCHAGAGGSPSAAAASVSAWQSQWMQASWKLAFRPQASSALPRYSGETLTGRTKRSPSRASIAS